MGQCSSQSPQKKNQKRNPNYVSPRKNNRDTTGHLEEDQRHAKYEAALEFFCDNHQYFFSQYLTQPYTHTVSNNFRVITEQNTQEKFIATKLAKPSNEEQRKELYIRSYQLAKLDHPNVVKTTGLYEEHTGAYLVQEFCEGDNILERVAKRHYKSEQEMCQIISQVLHGLSYIHQNGVLHLNIKPTDLIYRDNDKQAGIVKLTNFGIVGDFKWNRKPFVSQQINFKAPEQFQGQGSAKTDVWSVGVVTYLLVSGQLPFEDKDNSSTQHNITRGSLEFKGAVFETLSDEAKDLIKKMLTFTETKRPTVKDCLKHPWFNLLKSKGSAQKKLHESVVYNLKQRNNENSIMNACLIYLIDQGIQKQESENLIIMFQRLDKDNSGFISRSELIDCLKNFMSEEEAEVQAKTFLKQNPERINYQKFLQLTADRRQFLRKGRIQKMFDAIDYHHHGYITQNDIREFSKRLNYKIANIDDFFKEIDVDHNGQISFKEFANAFSNYLKSSGPSY